MAEKQYVGYADFPRTTLGLRANVWWQTDPRSLLFSMARYKFVGKMLSGKYLVLEVGCGDAFCTRLVQQEVRHIMAVDFDLEFVHDVVERQKDVDNRIDIQWFNILDGPIPNRYFDAAYALDVIEHIPPFDTARFMQNIVASLAPHGVLILGTPNIESQRYASDGSKAGHVNLFDAVRLRALMGQYFHHVFSFGMNDETLHTGFSGMAHYLLAIGAEQRLTKD